MKIQHIDAVIDRLRLNPTHDDADEKKYRHPVRKDTGALLSSLVLARNAHSILEIGTAYGLSTCFLGYYGAHIDTIEKNQEVSKHAKQNLDEAGVSARVVHNYALNGIKEIANKETATYDLVFLDGNKKGYREQIELLEKESLLDAQTLIVADNVTNRYYEVTDFLELMDKRGTYTIIETECGLLVGYIQHITYG